MFQFMFKLIKAKYSSRRVKHEIATTDKKASVSTIMRYLLDFCDPLNATAVSTSHRNLAKPAAKLQQKR